LIRQYDVAKQTAELLRTPEREERLAQLKKLDDDKARLDGDVAVLTNAKQGFLVRQQQLTDAEKSARATLESSDNAMKLSRMQLPASIREADVADVMQPLLADASPWKARIENARVRAFELTVAATERRNERNHIRNALADARDE